MHAEIFPGASGDKSWSQKRGPAYHPSPGAARAYCAGNALNRALRGRVRVWCCADSLYASNTLRLHTRRVHFECAFSDCARVDGWSRPKMHTRRGGPCNMHVLTHCQNGSAYARTRALRLNVLIQNVATFATSQRRNVTTCATSQRHNMRNVAAQGTGRKHGTPASQPSRQKHKTSAFCVIRACLIPHNVKGKRAQGGAVGDPLERTFFPIKSLNTPLLLTS